MTDLIPFSYADHQVRVITIEGEPWFVLADLARVLGITGSTVALTEREDEQS